MVKKTHWKPCWWIVKYFPNVLKETISHLKQPVHPITRDGELNSPAGIYFVNDDCMNIFRMLYWSELVIKYCSCYFICCSNVVDNKMAKQSETRSNILFAPDCQSFHASTHTHTMMRLEVPSEFFAMYTDGSHQSNPESCVCCSPFTMCHAFGQPLTACGIKSNWPLNTVPYTVR